MPMTEFQLEEIRKIVEYPDRRIKPIVYTMASSGIRLGAWNYLKWNHMIRRLDDMGRRMVFMAEICDNALDKKSSFEE